MFFDFTVLSHGTTKSGGFCPDCLYVVATFLRRLQFYCNSSLAVFPWQLWDFDFFTVCWSYICCISSNDCLFICLFIIFKKLKRERRLYSIWNKNPNIWNLAFLFLSWGHTLKNYQSKHLGTFRFSRLSSSACFLGHWLQCETSVIFNRILLICYDWNKRFYFYILVNDLKVK